MSDISALLIGLAMLVGNAYFVGAEFAVMSVRRSQLEPLATEGKPGAKTALWAIQHVSLMLATAQFGVTVCSVTLGAVAEPAIAHLIEPIFESFNVPEALVHPISFTIALLIASYLHVVLGEMVPKNLSIALPVGSARLLAPPLVWLTKILRPVIWLLNATASASSESSRKTKSPRSSRPRTSPRSLTNLNAKGCSTMNRVCSRERSNSPITWRVTSWCPWKTW